MYKDRSPSKIPDDFKRKVFHYKGKKYVLTTYTKTTETENGVKAVSRLAIFHTNGRKVSTELSDQILADIKKTVDNVRRQVTKLTQGDN